MFSYLASFFSSPAAGHSTGSTPAETCDTPPAPSTGQLSSNPAHTHRNRKKRLAKKKSKQRRRQSTMTGQNDSDEGEEIEDDEDFPDADDDLSYIPLEPDNMSPPSQSALPTRPPQGAQPSQIPPKEVLDAVSRLPPLLPNGERLPNDERAKRIIKSQGFVPVEDEDGGLHVGVKVREGVVAVMGKDGPLLFQM